MDAPQCPVTGCRGGPDTSLEGAPVGGGLVPSGLFVIHGVITEGIKAG